MLAWHQWKQEQSETAKYTRLPASGNALLVNCVQRLRTWSRSKGPHSGEMWTQYVTQPTECINQLLKLIPQNIQKKSEKLSKGRDLILMELKLDVSCQLQDVYTRFQAPISKYVKKKRLRKLSGGGKLNWDPPSECVCPPRGQNCPAMTKISTVEDTCYFSVCTKSEGSI